MCGGGPLSLCCVGNHLVRLRLCSVHIYCPTVESLVQPLLLFETFKEINAAPSSPLSEKSVVHGTVADGGVGVCKSVLMTLLDTTPKPEAHPSSSSTPIKYANASRALSSLARPLVLIFRRLACWQFECLCSNCVDLQCGIPHAVEEIRRCLASCAPPIALAHAAKLPNLIRYSFQRLPLRDLEV